MEKEYDNNYTKNLGHHTWKFLHILAEGYKPYNNNDKKKMSNFIYNLSDIYTCDKCKPGFKKYLMINKPITCCNKHFIQYINKMENDIKNNKY